MEFRLGFEKISYFLHFKKALGKKNSKSTEARKSQRNHKIGERGHSPHHQLSPKPSAYYRRYYSYLKAGGKDPVKRESEDAK